MRRSHVLLRTGPSVGRRDGYVLPHARNVDELEIDHFHFSGLGHLDHSSLLPAFTLSFFTAGDICYLTLPTCLPFPVGPSDVRPVMVQDEFATFQAIIVIAPELDLHFWNPWPARVFPFPFPSMLLAIKAHSIDKLIIKVFETRQISRKTSIDSSDELLRWKCRFFLSGQNRVRKIPTSDQCIWLMFDSDGNLFLRCLFSFPSIISSVR